MASKLVYKAGQWLWGRRRAKAVTIVSPWLSVGAVKLVVGHFTGPITVVFRWPQQRSDARFLHLAAIQLLYARPNVRLCYVDGPLHAKVYVSEGYGLVTSANLSNQGLNSILELGSEVDASPGSALEAWLAGLPVVPLGPNAYRVLVGGLAAVGPQAPQPPFPSPPKERGRVEFVGELFRRHGMSAGHLPVGFGQNAWSGKILDRRGCLVRAHLSVAGNAGFHFDISKNDHRDLHARRAPVAPPLLDGLVLAPSVGDRNTHVSPPDGPDLVLLPRPHLCGRSGLQAQAFSTGPHTKLTLSLERRGRELWLRLPNPSGREVKGRKGVEAPLKRSWRSGKVWALPATAWRRVK